MMNADIMGMFGTVTSDRRMRRRRLGCLGGGRHEMRWSHHRSVKSTLVSFFVVLTWSCCILVAADDTANTYSQDADL